MDFNKNLKRIRESRGYTQTALAELTKLSQSTIACFENETQPKQPNAHSLYVLSKALGVSMDELYQGKRTEFTLSGVASLIDTLIEIYPETGIEFANNQPMIRITLPCADELRSYYEKEAQNGFFSHQENLPVYLLEAMSLWKTQQLSKMASIPARKCLESNLPERSE